jgi:Kef-type K+ transport system membrane component KefB
VCDMERKLDVVTTVSAVCVAAYVAIAIGYVARNHLGFSLQEIREVAVVTAVVIAALIGIDFFGKKLRKAK